jgi:ribosomal subunit interface protein
MQILTTGKNLDIGDSLRGRIEERLSNDAARYFDGVVRCHVTVEKQRGYFRTECTLHLSTGLTLQAHGEGADAYASADSAVDRLERQLKRYKRRLKNHHNDRREPVSSSSAPTFVLASAEENESGEQTDLAPVVIAESSSQIVELTVGEAVMQLDISGLPFVLFRNGRHGGLNIVYRREDGHIGWIDPGGSATTS